MAEKVSDQLYYELDGQLSEIKRQLRQQEGYPYNPEMLKESLRELIEGRFQGRPPVGRYFMTVTLGERKDPGRAVEASGKKVSDLALEILEKTPISSEQLELDIYEVSGDELGFTDAAPRQEIYDRAFGLCFKKSPAEVGPKSRVKCNDERLRLIGMDPITDACGHPYLFRLNDDGLNTYCGRPDRLWDPDIVWLFVWPRHK